MKKEIESIYISVINKIGSSVVSSCHSSRINICLIMIIFHMFLIWVDGNLLDDDDFSDAESVHDYDKESSNSNGLHGDKLSIEILEPIKSLGLVEKLWRFAQPIAENVNELLKENEKDLYKK